MKKSFEWGSLGFAVVLVAAGASSATAEDLYRLADTLGSVLGAEDACSLSIDPEKVRVFVRKNVPADDIEFMANVTQSARLAPMTMEQMTDATRAAHCEQMQRLSVSFGIDAQ